MCIAFFNVVEKNCSFSETKRGELCKCKNSIKSRRTVIANENRLKFAEALGMDSIRGPIAGDELILDSSFLRTGIKENVRLPIDINAFKRELWTEIVSLNLL